jgi:alpha-glucosidase
MGSNKLHAAFNFQLIASPWRPHNILEVVQRWENMLGSDDWPNYVLNNHDEIRSATRWRTGENDARLKVAAALLLTLRGTPYLYYGEEIGMRDLPIRSKSEVKDPVGLRYWPFYRGRDGCRSPMQWDGTPGAGFTRSAQPWLPVHANAAVRNVAAQEQDPSALLNWYRRLIALRRATPALTAGMFLPLTHDTHYLLAYLRETSDQTVLVALNFSRRRKRLVLGQGLARAGWRLLLSTHRATLPPLRGPLLALEPNEALILQME